MLNIFDLTNGFVFDCWAIVFVLVCWGVYKLIKKFSSKKYTCLLCDKVVYGEPACKECDYWARNLK